MGHADIQTTMRYLNHKSRADDAQPLSAAFRHKNRKQTIRRSTATKKRSSSGAGRRARHRVIYRHRVCDPKEPYGIAEPTRARLPTRFKDLGGLGRGKPATSDRVGCRRTRPQPTQLCLLPALRFYDMSFD